MRSTMAPDDRYFRMLAPRFITLAGVQVVPKVPIAGRSIFQLNPCHEAFKVPALHRGWDMEGSRLVLHIL